MADLSTEYLGLKLANPLVPSSSPLTNSLDGCRRLEDAGAAAVILPSLFEEEIHQFEETTTRFLHEQAIGFGEADSFLPIPDDYSTTLDGYLELLESIKASLAIPVIASLNGISSDGWIRYGKQLQEAGADALELNIYYVAANIEESSAEVEGRYVRMLYELREQVTLPITMKLSSQFSSPGHFVRNLQAAGAGGVSLFNRFYQPDIDLDTRNVLPKMHLSHPYEALLRIHWLAILHGRVDLSLAATGGFHTAEDALKAVMAGADVVHLCAVLLQQGPEQLTRIRDDMQRWLEDNGYASLQQLKGCVSQQHAIDPAAYERTNYVKLLDGFQASRGVWR
ncbi:MAG: dihydroorotate dehydrogenase-like protein [Thiogranum sp.]|nr:dihydroorotate dehydrogenase-like protein [Thiogranum sp.]